MAGKRHSASDQKLVQAVHDTSMNLGADCSGGGMSSWMGMSPYESARVLEAALPMDTSHDNMRGHLRTALMLAHGVTDSYSSNGPYIRDTFPGHVVYSHQGQTLKRSYSSSGINPPKITLGEPRAVHTAYVDTVGGVQEGIAVLSDMDPAELNSILDERYISQSTRDKMSTADFAGKGTSFPIKNQTDVDAAARSIGRAGASNLSHDQIKANIIKIAKKKGLTPPASWTESVVTTPLEDGFEVMYESLDLDLPLKEGARLTAAAPYVPIKIISPGWGSSGFYSKELLQRDGPAIYKKGTHMYWNHSDEANRNPSELAAVLNEDAKWDDNGKKGPGLYSVAKVFSDYTTQVSEKGPHIGVSISALGKATEGEAEGKKGKIIQKLVHADSADFVGKAGRGGEVLVEGQRRIEPHQTEGDSNMSMTEQEQTSLREAQARTAALEKDNAALVLERNQAIATAAFIEALKAEGAHCSVEVAKAMMSNPPLKEGKLDIEAIKALAKTTKENFKPIAVGPKTGKVLNLGTGQEAVTEGAAEDVANLKELGTAMQEMGLTEAAAKIAVAGRI